MKREEMPIGFSMALAQNPEAMQKFANLSEEKKKEITERTLKDKAPKKVTFCGLMC